MRLLDWLVDPSGLTPHGFCLLWEPGLIWLHVVSDAGIALAYYTIPLALVAFARRRRDFEYGWILWLFASFILACGTTHIFSILTLWVPAYGLEGVVKAATALISLVTAALLWPLLPQVLALPSPTSLRVANDALRREAAEKDALLERLRASEARFRALYQCAPVPMQAIGMDFRVREVSNHWLDLFGYAREEVIGRNVLDFYDPASRDAARAANRMMAEGGSELRGAERRMRRKDGEVLDILASARLERDADGRPAEILMALTDVTDRKRTEAALRTSEERLRQAQKMEAIGQLTGGIAHDFNNALMVIWGSLELIAKRLPEGEARLRRLVESSMQAAARAARLTSQLLSFSRRQRLEAQPLAPVAVAEGIRALLARSLGPRIALRIEPAPEGIWPCLADRNQLESALLNLVLNARAAIADRGTVTIRAANLRFGAAADPEDPEAISPGDYVAVTVEDDGSGMTEEVRRRAFEPFFTTKPAGEGTGLGLAQIYGFARQSGGTVTIDSAPGQGTRVTILLPRSATAPASEEAGRDDGTAEAKGQGETVLVVEDEEAVRHVAAETLAALGYRAVQAADAEAALAVLRREPQIVLLFTDIVMPGACNGVDLAIEARRLRPELPVLFTSGYSEHSLLARWPGEAQVLSKPYRAGDLAQSLREILAAPALAEVGGGG